MLILVTDRIVNVPGMHLACNFNVSVVMKLPLKLKNFVARVMGTCRRMR